MYIYQADCYCDDCGQAIRDRIDKELESACEDPLNGCDDSTYDSNDYPKYGSEDDAYFPCHCAAGEECENYECLPDGTKVGAVLGGLTPAGREDVAEELRGDVRSEVVLFWRQHYEIDWPEQCRTVHLRNTDDDPTAVMCEVMGPYAADWADDDQTIDGSSWETSSDTPGFAYTIIMDRPGLVDDLRNGGYALDLSEYGECSDEDFAIASAAAELEMNYREVADLWEFAAAEIAAQLRLPGVAFAEDRVTRSVYTIAAWRKENGK